MFYETGLLTLFYETGVFGSTRIFFGLLLRDRSFRAGSISAEFCETGLLGRIRPLFGSSLEGVTPHDFA